jgi:hypothetical protein
MTGSPPDQQPQQTDQKASDDDQEARELGIDPESYRYWKRAVAALPPMTPEEIATVGAVLRRIDARVAAQRGQQPARCLTVVPPLTTGKGGGTTCSLGLLRGDR